MATTSIVSTAPEKCWFSSAADFEDILVPRPDMLPVMGKRAKSGDSPSRGESLPFRIHTTYNETIERALNVYEEVNREIPFDGLHWFLRSLRNDLDRTSSAFKALGGGIAVQNRMAFQGEYFVARYGSQQAKPTRRSAHAGKGVPWEQAPTQPAFRATTLTFPSTGLSPARPSGGSVFIRKRTDWTGGSAQALHHGSSWFSTEDGQKGALALGQLADLAVLKLATIFQFPKKRSSISNRTYDRGWEGRLCQR